MELAYREFRDGDERGIFELHSRVFPSAIKDYDVWLPKWRWQYQENPLGRSRIWLAVDGDRVVGQYPTLPWKMRVGGEAVMTVQNINLMTDPDYRGRGVFQQLESTAMAALGNSGVRMIWGFPNASALRGHIKSGWHKFGQYSLLFHLLNPLNLLLGKPDPERVIRATEGFARVSRFDERCNAAIDEFGKSKDLTTARDADFLNWRYPDSMGFRKYCSMTDQNVEGYFVYKLVKLKSLRTGMLFDMVYRDDAGLKRAVRSFLRVCSQDHASLAVFSSLTGELERKKLLRAGLSNLFFYDEISLFCAMLPPGSRTDPSQFKHMYFTTGDSDYNG